MNRPRLCRRACMQFNDHVQTWTCSSQAGVGLTRSTVVVQKNTLYFSIIYLASCSRMSFTLAAGLMKFNKCVCIINVGTLGNGKLHRPGRLPMMLDGESWQTRPCDWK